MEFAPTVNVLPILIIGLMIVAYYVRYKFFLPKEDLGAKNRNSKNWIQNRTKYPEANVFQFRPVFFKMGLIGALSFTLMAFSWTTYDEKGLSLIHI